MPRREDERELPKYFSDELARADAAWREREARARPARRAEPPHVRRRSFREALQPWLVLLLVLAAVIAVLLD